MIQLLPDNVANQIAAGEVIQRPSSAVKELLENAVDAKSSLIQLIIKDAGRTLIQVIDDGTGMNKDDAEMCFLRHATSKIAKAEDLFKISSKGFRGEALSSIAAVSHVELKTRTTKEDIGLKIIIEGSEIKSTEPVATKKGTSFSMKNLFYNIPARRNFLKSNAVETKHIIDEFQRIALAHPEIHFSMHNNGHVVFDLPISNRRQRIVNLMGKKFNERLVPIEEKTTISNISGFVVKPEFSKRTRGEQFLFVNNRFIKNSSINYAINQAFKDLISKDQFPSYFIYLEVPTESIDINIHPTKTEIKFDDERAIYTIVQSCIKNSLGKYNVSPTLDFEQETSFNVPPISDATKVYEPKIKVDPYYNPFKTNENKKNIEENIHFLRDNFQNEFDKIENNNELEQGDLNLEESAENNLSNSISCFQYKSRYIVTSKKTGLLLIDIFRAHQQIHFETLIDNYENKKTSSQKLIFPEQITLSEGDHVICMEIINELTDLGVDISDFGNNTIVLNGLPTGMELKDPKGFIESCIEDIKNENNQFEKPFQSLAWNISKGYALSRLKKLNNQEMTHLMDCLFSCKSPSINAHGHYIISEISEDEIFQKFN
ncbi:MAG: DNA mismatch repair protein MutL [Crocinitomicaceae bacterium]|nr:DNA mismatch repair protein MutL [Crocinitomicaceae bacterium]|tara:strand:- start:2837 stop:4639 length:1803 start_codon:yes stop_codon:yes gene_type:complete